MASRARFSASSPTGSLFPEQDVAPSKPAEQPPTQAQVAHGFFAEVVLDRPLTTRLTYSIPSALASQVAPGMRVVVPLGNLREVGVVVGTTDSVAIDPRRVKSVLKAMDVEPLLSPQLLELTRLVASEYACSWGQALHGILPAAMRREKGRRQVTRVRAAEAAQQALPELEASEPKQHRLLRTLVDIGGWIEARDVLRQLGLSESPLASLRKRGLVEAVRADEAGDALLGTPASGRFRPAQLSDAQRQALESIGSALAGGQAVDFLLQGVTGSGKTEVYLSAIERALQAGRGAIVLVPEIALTPQTVGWFRSRFERVAVLHSRMTDVQRYDTWRELRSGRTQVVVGARSALFAPVARLGIIVVDEEHEPSFKQDSTPRYHARDVARLRARLEGAVCVLGSATPSLETWTEASAGTVRRLVLPQRVTAQPLPPVEIVDMRTAAVDPAGAGLFSKRLRQLLEETKARHEQAILFLNRRGFAPVLWCTDCKHTLRCAHCDLALAWHKRIRRLVCHGCCEEIPLPKQCTTCSSPRLRLLGAGSERIEQEVQAALPAARVRRMDSDTMRRRTDYEETLQAFGRGEIDVLVGTQMIAKGLDFPRVTLVGIVNADTALHLPDFRASERTFQLISQVAGRAGRGAAAGRIVVQTTAPEHPAIRCAARHDFESFAAAESALRAELGYPPHGRFVRVIFEGIDEGQVLSASADCAKELDALLAGSDPQTVAVLGPAPAPIAMLRGKHRHHVLVKLPRAGGYLERVREQLAILQTGRSGARLVVDVDPVSML